MTLKSLAERIQCGPLLFDGAMGTELYRRGHFVNKSLEGVTLTDPRLVNQVHREYVEAGSEALETHTFASNRVKLARVGLENQLEAQNRAAVELARDAAGDRAYVVGAIGPSGLQWPTLSEGARDDVVEALVEQARILIDAGADGLMLETFGFLGELERAMRGIRPLSDMTVIAHASFTGNAVTGDAARPEHVGRVLIDSGADVIGANCADGPMELYHIAERLIPLGAPVSIFPNAGYPKKIDDRMIYMATPEYFGVFARRYLKLGVTLIGGCCGTTSEHIRSMHGAVKMMSGGTQEREHDAAPALVRRSTDAEVPPLALASRSALAAKVESGDGFVVSVEVNPPTGLDPSRAIQGARMLQAAGVDVVNIADGPRASVRMSNWSLALAIQRELQMESIVHVCMRDRNLLGLQSDILAYHALGLHNLVIITGDPPKMGDYPHATAVFDLDSVGAIRMVRDFNHGLNPAGRALGGRTGFLISCGAEPAALDYDRELRRLERKVENGAELIMTQPVYDPLVLDRFLNDIKSLNTPVLVGLLPLASAANAEFLHNEIPGMQIPASIRARMAKVGKGPEARAVGVSIAQDALLAVRDRVRGAYIMPPFGRYEAAIEILSVVGYEIPPEYVEAWRT